MLDVFIFFPTVFINLEVDGQDLQYFSLIKEEVKMYYRVIREQHTENSRRCLDRHCFSGEAVADVCDDN